MLCRRVGADPHHEGRIDDTEVDQEREHVVYRQTRAAQVPSELPALRPVRSQTETAAKEFSIEFARPGRGTSPNVGARCGKTH